LLLSTLSVNLYLKNILVTLNQAIMRSLHYLFSGLLLLYFANIYGQDPAIVMTTTDSVGSLYTFYLEANEDDVPIQVDYGDSVLIDYTIGAYLATLSGYLGSTKTVKVYGTGLAILFCNNNHLTSLDVSNDTSLIRLYCGTNLLTTLDLNQNINLETLECFENNLTILSVTNNTKLKTLACHTNQLTELNLSQNEKLNFLVCSDNQLITLDVSNNDSLSHLNCNNNQIDTIYLGNNNALTYLDLGNNLLKSVDVSMDTMLTTMDCSNNQISHLNVTINATLTFLDCSDNKLDFETLPRRQTSYLYYIYTPQAPIEIAKSINTSEPLDLSDQLNVNEYLTNYVWKTKDGDQLDDDLDYILNNGITTFLHGQDSIYCEMTNEAYPDFENEDALKTTCIKVTGSQSVNEIFNKEIYLFQENRALHIFTQFNARVSVYDISGRLVANKNIDPGESIIPMQNTGVYIVKLTRNNEVITRKVVIK
jgi:hypothetical protein